jgi:GLPGLI family protein
MIKRFFYIVLLGMPFFGHAQQSFFSTVKVEYEKTVYVHQLAKEIDQEWYDWIKDKMPAANISYCDFIADESGSIFKPGREIASNKRGFMDISETKNQVYTNFANGTTTSLKPVFEETFLVEDSLSKIKWKLTADTRIIAGYECRKAVGIIDDSVGVFAFYTDEITVPGGPESIHGLPGLILGMGIPRLHATWFATKVETNGVSTAAVKAPTGKAKKVNKMALFQQLDKVLKSAGTWGAKMILVYII